MEFTFKKKAVYPSKKALNLCIREKKAVSFHKLLPVALLAVLLVVAFGKFAVLDRYERLNEAMEASVATAAMRDELTLAVRDYNKVLEEYNHYSVSWMKESEQALVTRTEILDLVETMFQPKCQVQQLAASGNIVSVTLGGITLADTSRLVQILYAMEHVSNVSVYTASGKDEGENAQATVSMVITMGYPEEGEESQ